MTKLLDWLFALRLYLGCEPTSVIDWYRDQYEDGTVR